jgi:hypothetical protein
MDTAQLQHRGAIRVRDMRVYFETPRQPWIELQVGAQLHTKASTGLPSQLELQIVRIRLAVS